jgi:hypothetical protein
VRVHTKLTKGPVILGYCDLDLAAEVRRARGIPVDARGVDELLNTFAPGV